jgi:hypothetical protein
MVADTRIQTQTQIQSQLIVPRRWFSWKHRQVYHYPRMALSETMLKMHCGLVLNIRKPGYMVYTKKTNILQDDDIVKCLSCIEKMEG